MGHSRRVRSFFHGANTLCPLLHSKDISVSKFLYSSEWIFHPSCSISCLIWSKVILAIYLTSEHFFYFFPLYLLLENAIKINYFEEFTIFIKAFYYK